MRRDKAEAGQEVLTAQSFFSIHRTSENAVSRKSHLTRRSLSTTIAQPPPAKGRLPCPSLFGVVDAGSRGVLVRLYHLPRSPPAARGCHMSAFGRALGAESARRVPRPSLVLIGTRGPRRAWRGSATPRAGCFESHASTLTPPCLYAAPVDMGFRVRYSTGSERPLSDLRTEAIQDPACGLRRISLLGR